MASSYARALLVDYLVDGFSTWPVLCGFCHRTFSSLERRVDLLEHLNGNHVAHASAGWVWYLESLKDVKGNEFIVAYLRSPVPSVREFFKPKAKANTKPDRTVKGKKKK